MKRVPPPDIPGYRMLRALERGGMSEIWLAEQVALSRSVAIKLLTPGEDFEVRVARFRQEAATIARFDHPNVVGIIEFGQTADGRLYYSMPYVPNGSLIEADLLGDSERLRTVLSELLQALAYVHRQGVVHRDVKPENVLFDSVGRARLADFGVSRIMTDTHRQTRVGETFGSSYYMSPEQARGELPDGRSDLYSVGVLTYELLTGEPPFQGPDHLSIVIAHLQNPVPKLPESCRQWQSFVDTAMAKRPEKRFPDAEAMLHALRRVPDEPNDLRRLRGFLRQPGFAIGAMAATVLVALLAIAALGVRSGGTESVAAGTEPVMTPGTASLPAPVDLVYDESLGAVVERDTATGVRVRDAAARERTTLTGTGNRPLGSGPRPGESQDAGAGARQRGENAGDREGTAGTSASPAVAAPTSEAAGSGARQTDERAALRDLASTAGSPGERRADVQSGAPGRSGAQPHAPATAAVAPVRTLTSTIPNPGTFVEVPRVPLLILGGARDERLARLDALLELGRRNIESERARSASALSSASEEAERARLEADIAQREQNYETWRRHVEDLRDRSVE